MPLPRPVLLLLPALLLASCGDDDEKKVAFGPDLKQVAGVTNPNGSGPAAAATATAAKDDDDGDSSQGPPKISGNWAGTYSWSDGTHVMNVRAAIEQNGSGLVIRTSKAAPGRLLTGQIRSNGRIRLTDSDDGEIWSTFYGPVSASHDAISEMTCHSAPSTSILINRAVLISSGVKIAANGLASISTCS